MEAATVIDWKKIESSIGQIIPMNVKTFLCLGGYDSVLSIKQIDAEKMHALEKYLQNLIQSDRRLLEKLDKNDKTTLVYTSQNVFNLLPGHSAILLALPELIKTMCDIDMLQACNQEPEEFSVILSKLIESARKNKNKPKNAFKYDDIIKNFSTYIFLLCGRTCYETLYKNLPIPSIKTIREYI